MRNHTLLKVLAPTLVLFSAQAVAVPFQSIDPRSFGMGGAGVASGTSANAGFMNPALLAAAHEDEDFSLELPIIAARFSDADDLMDELDTYQDTNLESSLDVAVDAFLVSPADPVAAAAVGAAAGDILAQFLKLNNKVIQGEFSGGFVVGIPSKKFGASLTANARVVAGGLLDVTAADQALINGIITDAGTSPAALALNSAVVAQGTGTDIIDTLTTNLQARGAVMSEVGISLAREVEIGGHTMALGITPKYVKVTTFDYQVDVNTADLETDQGKKEYTDFNFDIGMAKTYNNGWKTGVVVKNLLGEDYQTVLGNTIKIEPQARVGIAHSNEWTTVALDVDLNESESAGFDSKTQYVALGAELDIFDTVDIRVGYRHNMSDSDTSLVTAGLGFSLFGAHTDLALGANDDEIGISFQLGFRF